MFRYRTVRCPHCGADNRLRRASSYTQWCSQCRSILARPSHKVAWWRNGWRKLSTMRLEKIVGAVAVVCVVAAAGVVLVKEFGIGCPIKGNISYVTGERIYHLPVDEYYDETVINLLNGERWFCTPLEAELAGWRRSLR